LLPAEAAAIEGETLMSRCLNLAFAAALACFVVGCATQTAKPTLTSGQRIPKVRTTAYTHHEGGSGAHNAIGTYLSGRQVLSAASDWSRYPLGTRFRLADTNEEYVIDDYGNALVGTDTIDLYKPSRSEVRDWGVRYIDIDILQWGSEDESLKVLAPRCKHSCVKKMVLALEKKKGKTVAQNNTSKRPAVSN
jgi:3D (Asp-Asp-Asp) domain-containing protein